MPTTMPAPSPATAASERAALVARYRTGYADLLDVIADVTGEELDWRPAPGVSTARELVHHLADAETIGAVRLRRLLAEDAPALAAFDEATYARRLCYAARPIEAALRLVEAAHATTAELLDGMTESDWRRGGSHSEEGAYPVTRWLAFHAAHTHDHAAEIRLLREAWAARRG